jgi:hypothetical protein
LNFVAMSSQGKSSYEEPETPQELSAKDHDFNRIPVAIAQDAELVTEKGNVITSEGAVLSLNNSGSDLSTNVFADPEVKAFYIDVYEKAKYECRHVFDADLT